MYTTEGYTSLLKTSSGELLKTLLMLLSPISNTKMVIPGKNNKNGTPEGTNGSSNKSVANN